MILLDTSGLLSAIDASQRHHGNVMRRYPKLSVGLADASIVVLGERHGIRDLLTLDERHFRVLRADGKRFRILPADR